MPSNRDLGESALKDVTNPAAASPVGRWPTLTKTFRRKQERQAPDSVSSSPLCPHRSTTASPAAEASPPSSPEASPAHSHIAPHEPESGMQQQPGRGRPKKRGEAPKQYSRKAMPSASEQEAAAHAKWYAHMRAHFAKVDAFELVVESPPVADSRAPVSPSLTTSAAPRTLQYPAESDAAACDPATGSDEQPQQISQQVEPLEDLAGQDEARQAQGQPATPLYTPGLEGAILQLRAPEEPDTPADSLPHSAEHAAAPLSADDTPHSGALSDGAVSPGAASPEASLATAVSQDLLAPKPMALGMSRRASVCIAHMADDGGRRGSTAVQPQADNAAASQARSNASEVRRPPVVHRLSNRLSISGALSRLSLGTAGASKQPDAEPSTTDALDLAQQPRSRHSSTRGSGMMSQRLSGPALDRRGTIIPGAVVSPIAESPAEASSPPAYDEPPPQIPADESAAADLASDLQARLQIGSGATLDQLQGTDVQADDTAVEIRDVTPKTAYEGLLHLAGQQAEADTLPSMDELLRRFDSMQSVRKLGEGTFGEAYGTAEGRVFKVLPLDGAQLVNGEVQKTAGEILAEAAITLALSRLRETGPPKAKSANATSGFVELFGLGLCRGAYSKVLSREWHSWDKAHGSENDPIDDFAADQLFMVYVTADGGRDLEHVQVHSYEEAVSILLQVALILAVAEEACEFEHRDLHWGNLLIKRTAAHAHTYRLRGVDVEVVSHGIEVTLIDFTLSRLRTGKGQDVQFCNLSDDPALFQGPKGDCQADTYRRMKAKTRGQWEGFHPVTNTLWMHYLADIMLSCKKPPCSSEQLRGLRGFRKRALSCKSSGELLWDELFQGQWLALPPKKQ